MNCRSLKLAVYLSPCKIDSSELALLLKPCSSQNSLCIPPPFSPSLKPEYETMGSRLSPHRALLECPLTWRTNAQGNRNALHNISTMYEVVLAWLDSAWSMLYRTAVDIVSEPAVLLGYSRTFGGRGHRDWARKPETECGE